MTIEEIKKTLYECTDTNPEFYATLTPNCKPALGVRIPKLRELAKKIAKDDYKSFLHNNPMDLLEMEMLQAFVIGYAKDNIDIILKYFEEFVPLVHDWAVNDGLCQTFKITKKYPKEVFAVLMKYKDSHREFEVRVVAVMLMSYYLTDDYISEVITILDSMYAKEYYAKMGIAWAFATVMAKYPDKCMAYFESDSCHLDDWTYNKAIQKMIESYRVSDEIKEQVRRMKR